MRKCDLQLFVQDYVVENSIETRWEGSKHGKEWFRYFREIWVLRVKVKAGHKSVNSLTVTVDS
jgi:hypothetical protein